MSAQDNLQHHTNSAASQSPQAMVDDHSIHFREQGEWILVNDYGEEGCEISSSHVEHEASASTLDALQKLLPMSPAQRVLTIRNSGNECDAAANVQDVASDLGNALGVARVQNDYNRQEHRNLCRHIKAALDRIEILSCSQHAPPEHKQALKQQLSDDIMQLDLRLDAIEQSERDVVRLEQLLRKTNPVEDPVDAAFGRGTCTYGRVYKDPPMVAAYLKHAGDASVASERITELEYEMAKHFSSNELGSCSSALDAEYVLSEEARRHALEHDFERASRRAEELREVCVATGIDIESARRGPMVC